MQPEVMHTIAVFYARLMPILQKHLQADALETAEVKPPLLEMTRQLSFEFAEIAEKTGNEKMALQRSFMISESHYSHSFF